MRADILTACTKLGRIADKVCLTLRLCKIILVFSCAKFSETFPRVERWIR